MSPRGHPVGRPFRLKPAPPPVPAGGRRIWQGGEYRTQPPSLRTAIEMIWLVGSNPVLRQQEPPMRAQADQVIDGLLERAYED